MPARIIIPIGTRFGKLLVQRFAGKVQGHFVYECVCDCGRIATIRGSSLAADIKGTKSCGCLRRERTCIHGLHNTPEYKAWQSIKLRCYDPNCPNYHRYGARGIKMHKPWLNDPAAFINYVGKRPSPSHSIDRINNNGNYEPDNLRWATDVEQMTNRSNNNYLTLDGRKMALSQWARDPIVIALGIGRSGLVHRKRRGWSDHDILTTPKIIGRQRAFQ